MLHLPESNSFLRGRGMLHKHLIRPKVSHVDRYERFAAVWQGPAALDDAKNFEKAFQKAFRSAVEAVAGSRRAAVYPRRQS
jgi:hypothetical protein